MSRSGFGEHLKRERELRGVSRDEICTATRIGIRYLEALENEQWGVLPGGIFNRGFVRAVARFLGLDEDDLLAEYDLASRGEDPRLGPAITPPVPHESVKSPAVRFAVIGTLCLIVLLGAGWFARGWHSKMNGQAAHERGNAPTAVSVAGPENGAAVNPALENAAGSKPVLAASNDHSGTASQGLELKIEAGKETSVSVSADGSKVFEGSMIAGQSRTFTAQNAIDISAKDAGALLLELNGQTLAPLGPPGQPGNLTLTRSDLKSTGGGAD